VVRLGHRRVGEYIKTSGGVIMEYLFRGITEDGRIVHGGFSIHATGKIIQSKDEIALAGKVIKTEMFTGLTDKKDERIFEGQELIESAPRGYRGRVIFNDGKFEIKGIMTSLTKVSIEHYEFEIIK
jgi:hypothetical protein